MNAPPAHPDQQSKHALVIEWCFVAAALLPVLAAVTLGVGVAIVVFTPLTIAACLIAAALEQHWEPQARRERE